MRKISNEELKEILKKHEKWLNNEKGGERADLSGADLRYKDLKIANLNNANLNNANLRYADLKNADLSCADLTRADLSYANLIYADLRYADLSCADLSGADLSYANLRYADLKNVDLSGADLSRANLRYAKLNHIFSGSLIGQKVVSIQVDTSRINNQISYWADLGIWTTGCFQGTLKELRKAINKTHKNNDFLKRRYERAINYILHEVEEDEKKAKKAD